jgi:hypothetical protein
MLSWLGAKGCSLGGNVSLGDPYATGGSSDAGANGDGGETSSSTGGVRTSGGNSAMGGRIGVATGGVQTSGGDTAVGGESTDAGAGGTTGGKANSATGGVTLTGGSKATGGISATGGSKATGGISATGGSKATGGISATGGSKATGGISATGGSKATGGIGSTGGATQTGGSTTGGASGGIGGSSEVASQPDGEFTAELVTANSELGTPAFTKFLGIVYDHPSPDVLQLELDSEQNGCRLMVPKTPFCSPSCGSTGVCTDENVCTPWGQSQDVGVVHVTGLGPSELVLEPFPPGYMYQPNSTLPYPPCIEGSAIMVQTTAFHVQAKCIAPLTLLGTDPIPVMAGNGVALSWTPPGQSGATRIEIQLDISHHGGKKGEIDCNVADTGSFTIPEPLVTKLVSLGLAGYPTIVVRRVSTGYSLTDKIIRLTVASGVERSVNTGVRSCSEASDCPTGLQCRADLTCR